jgi:hypothetical protein
VEADLGLNPRIDEAVQRHRRLIVLGLDKRAIVDRAPDGLVHAVAVPDRPIGKADLAADRTPVKRNAMRVQGLRRRIAIVRRHSRESVGERRHFPR